MSQRRLLLVTQHFWPENFRINDIVDGLLADGIAVDVLCGLPNYPKGEWFPGYTAKGPLTERYETPHGSARVFRSREIPRRGNTGPRIFANYVSWPLTAAAALRRLPGDYDAVLCYNTSPVLMCWPAILAARRFRAPLTTYVLDIWPENLYSVLPVKNRLLRAVAADVSDWLYRWADRLIALSPGLETRLRQRVGEKTPPRCIEKTRRYAVIPQYCEDFYAVPACDEALKKEGAGRFTVLFAGNFSPAQSLETALHALAALKAQGRNDVRLVLVGDGMSRAALEALCDTLDLRDRVRFFGSVPPQRIPALAGAADALLISLSDSPDLGLTIPAKLASCMAAARPLLVSLDGEGAAAARESGGALVSAACDAPALAENICALADASEQRRAAMGQASFAYYSAHYRRDALLAQLEEFIF